MGEDMKKIVLPFLLLLITSNCCGFFKKKPAYKDLISVASEGDLEKVKELVEKNKVPLDPLAKTALHAAVENRKFEIVKYLVGRGANVNAKNKSSFTPLRLAIENLPGIEPKTKFQKKIVESALYYPLKKIIEHLIKNGAIITQLDINEANKKGQAKIEKFLEEAMRKQEQKK